MTDEWIIPEVFAVRTRVGTQYFRRVAVEATDPDQWRQAKKPRGCARFRRPAGTPITTVSAVRARGRR